MATDPKDCPSDHDQVNVMTHESDEPVQKFCVTCAHAAVLQRETVDGPGQ